MSKFIIYKPCNKILIYEYLNLFEITNHLFNINALLYHLNALDKSRRKQTSWCQECDKVFDNRIDADIHKENVNHKVKIIEFWTISR
jgi:hypothetical protein